MDCFDALVVGSGPAGVFTAYALKQRSVLLIDPGYGPGERPALRENFFALRRSQDLFDTVIGRNFEGLNNLHRKAISMKLKAPHMTYVIRDWERLAPLVSSSFEAVISLARGGLANAWGAGAYRFSKNDIEGWPVDLAEFAPFYEELTAHIGIAGDNDDLAFYFGEEKGLLPPLQLSGLAARLLGRYEAKREFFQRRGIRIGRPRLAVATVPHRGRPAYDYRNLEFYEPYNPAIYNPASTLEELIRAGQVTYRPGYLALSFREQGSHVEVAATNLKTNETERFCARKVFLAAGALNTARIVLRSSEDFQTRLPILDNPMSCILLFDLAGLGKAPDLGEGSLAQLNLIYDDPPTGRRFQGSLYGTNGPLRSDTLFQSPLAASSHLACARVLSQAMALLMLFYPDRPSESRRLSLQPSGALEVAYEPEPRGEVEARLIAALRGARLFGSRGWCQYPPPGTSLHFAGSLPMKAKPGRYETDANGRLFGTNRVYISDAACFPTLPSKNHTLTIMANAMRIATRANADLL